MELKTSDDTEIMDKLHDIVLDSQKPKDEIKNEREKTSPVEIKYNEINEPLFYFSTNKGKNIYSVHVSAAKLSETFARVISSYQTDNIKGDLNISFDETLCERENWETEGKVKFYINTDDMLGYVHKYMVMWEMDPKSADYVEQKQIYTNEPLQVMKLCDVKFIEYYLDDSISKIKTRYGFNFDEEKYKSSVSYQRYIKIRLISELLEQVENFLKMQCLTNKLYAYIATLLWNANIYDLYEVTKDPLFAEIKEKTLNDWKENNPERYEKYKQKFNEDVI